MYVCVCKAVNERRIKEAVADGARSMRELRAQLGVCSCCGKCGRHAREVLESARQEFQNAVEVAILPSAGQAA